MRPRSQGMVQEPPEDVDFMKHNICFVACLLLLVASCQHSAQAENGNGAEFRFVDGDGVRDLYFGTKPIWRDNIKYDPADRDNTYKPYKHVYGFGKNAGPITKGPGGTHPHHRGVFLGFKT